MDSQLENKDANHSAGEELEQDQLESALDAQDAQEDVAIDSNDSISEQTNQVPEDVQTNDPQGFVKRISKIKQKHSQEISAVQTAAQQKIQQLEAQLQYLAGVSQNPQAYQPQAYVPQQGAYEQPTYQNAQQAYQQQGYGYQQQGVNPQMPINVRAELEAIEREKQMQEYERTQRSALGEVSSMIEAAKEVDGKFAQLMTNAPVTDAMVFGLYGLENPHAVLKHALQHNRSELEMLSKKPVPLQIARMAQLAKEFELKAPKRQTQKAPAPIQEERGRGSSNESDPNKMSAKQLSRLLGLPH